MTKFIGTLGMCLALGAGMTPAYAAESPQEAKDVVQQQSFKLLELMHTLKQDGNDFKFASYGMTTLYHVSAKFAHLADLNDLAKVVKEPEARGILEERWNELQSDIYTLCLMDQESLEEMAKGAADNARVVAELKASKKVLETACGAVPAKLPGR